MAKILLIDDEPEIGIITKKILEKNGHEVLIAKNGRSGLETLKKERPDLVLLDIMMPDKDGWEVCKEIKKDSTTSNIPVAIFTVRVSDESVEKSVEYAKADAHIGKPFETKELLNTINTLLKAKGSLPQTSKGK